MGPDDAPRARLPQPIPPSYYAQKRGAAPDGTRWAVALTALQDRIAVAWATRFGGRVARVPVLAGPTLAGGLATAAALVFLLARALPSPDGGLTSSPSSPPARDASPSVATAPVSAAQPPDETPAATPGTSPTAAPVTSSAAPASVTLLNAPLAVHRGRTVSLEARTTPGTTCSIDLGYASAPDLGPAVADAGGRVSWTWRVVGSVPAGTWPVSVTCGGATATTRIVLG